MKIQKMIARVQLDAVRSICVGVIFTGCATEPPPLPPNSAADPQVRSSSKAPRNLLAPDETTLAIERQLSATEAYAQSAEKMEHDMRNMPSMQHGGMQHEVLQRKNVEAEKKALSDEMKKSSEQMKQTSEPLKEKTEQTKPAARIYTCPMHLQVRSDKPGSCPICGMKLVPKKDGAHEEH